MNFRPRYQCLREHHPSLTRHYFIYLEQFLSTTNFQKLVTTRLSLIYYCKVVNTILCLHSRMETHLRWNFLIQDPMKNQRELNQRKYSLPQRIYKGMLSICRVHDVTLSLRNICLQFTTQQCYNASLQRGETANKQWKKKRRKTHQEFCLSFFQSVAQNLQKFRLEEKYYDMQQPVENKLSLLVQQLTMFIQKILLCLTREQCYRAALFHTQIVHSALQHLIIPK